MQEWEGKRPALIDLAGNWHLIGHLQSNKAAKAARLFDSVDSIDDFAVAQRLQRARTESAEVAHQTRGQLRVLIGHGIANAVVPLTLARADYRLLYAAGLDVRMNTYPATHRLHPDMLRDVNRWIIGMCNE